MDIGRQKVCLDCCNFRSVVKVVVPLLLAQVVLHTLLRLLSLHHVAVVALGHSPSRAATGMQC